MDPVHRGRFLPTICWTYAHQEIEDNHPLLGGEIPTTVSDASSRFVTESDSPFRPDDDDDLSTAIGTDSLITNNRIPQEFAEREGYTNY
jgi:hypothetical protein